MGAVDTTYTFTATDTITSAKMNNIIDQTTMTSDAIIGTTLDVASGKLKVNAQGITSNELASNAVTTVKITNLNVTTEKIADDAVTGDKIALGAIIPNLPSNFPIQIVGATKSDVQTITGSVSTWVDVSGLSITLTRSVPSASGKVRIQAAIPSTVDTYPDHGIAYRIMRDSSTVVGVGNADGNRLQATANTGYAGRYNNIPGLIDFIDTSPGSASTVNYKIQAKVYSGETGFINRSDVDTNIGDYIFRTISTMTLTELTP